MMDDPHLRLKELVAGSELPHEVRELCEKETTSLVKFLAVDETDTITGICSLSSNQAFLTMQCFIKASIPHHVASLRFLTLNVIGIWKERFSQFFLMVNSNEQDVEEFMQFGFTAVKGSADPPICLLFPPPSSLLKTFSVGSDCCHCDNICGICELLYEIKCFKYVPLVFLHHAMDVRKLGLSAVRTFVRLAIEMQSIQRPSTDVYQADLILTSKLSAVVEDEAMLLAFAWEKLNTGHFSEVDDNWRLLYAAVSLMKSVRLAINGEYLKAIAAVDLGLLMGDCVPDRLLQRYAQYCDSCLSPPTSIAVNEMNVTMPTCLKNSTPIPVFDELDKWDFIDQYLARSKPVIVKRLISDWYAVRNWNFEYLHRVLSRRIVPVEQGSKYTDNNWSQKLMTGSEFFRRCTLVDNNEPLYLAQHRLFDQVPHLSEDFSVPVYCDHCEDVERNCWIGPGGTISPLHTDPRENLFCQIMGKKFFRLVSPAHSENVYAFEDGVITNTSQVDALNPNWDEYPDFAKVQCWDGVVESGDVIFIPKGWWHLVTSLSNSISISFWFDA